MDTERLALGFVSESPAWHLVSPLYPDKIGGRPAWLALRHLPSPKQLSCPRCSLPMVFVLQVYSTIDNREDCFHRVLFLFMCRNGTCYNLNTDHNLVPFAVFRSQLARQNPYFSFEPPETECPSLDMVKSWIQNNQLPCAELYTSVCPVCGCQADKSCSKCKRVKYCSKSHQVLHWKDDHRSICGSQVDVPVGPSFTPNRFLLPEYKLCSEPAVPSADYSEIDTDESEPEDVDESFRLLEGSEESDQLESLAKRETKDEARFRRFKQVLSTEPDQVVRLERGGKPLWLSETPPVVADCEACGAKRVFEFQVTPQLLIYLKLDQLGKTSPDFGSLYIFTCSASCPLPRVIKSDGNEGATTSEIVEYQPEVVICQMVP
ncbi:Programmed cell death protein 2 [Paragonimus heterotremus]|uniref:Programmed cell death protein 2 n=1 Tax=Paragonimus heterotremus TaxID=100268 RepID=A0A8J4SH50_9TREM|nr:Programmed cell death protein 2 [Paragonimus heterotremus]